MEKYKIKMDIQHSYHGKRRPANYVELLKVLLFEQQNLHVKSNKLKRAQKLKGISRWSSIVDNMIG